SRRRHTRFSRDWSSDVCSSDLTPVNVEQYLAVADSRHAEDIAQRAREITEDADSAYDQALLLQTFLRSRPFEYSTTVPEPVTGEIGRASCRARVAIWAVGGAVN